MSGFKTPTAMSPPKKTNSSPQTRRPAGIMHRYDATPALMQTFEQLNPGKAESEVTAEAINTALSALSAIEQKSTVNRGRPGIDYALRASSPPLPAVQEAKMSNRRKPSLDRIRAGTFSPLSIIRQSSFVSRHRPHTAPLPTDQDLGPANHINNGTTVVNTAPPSCGYMSPTVNNYSPTGVHLPIPPPCPDLEVYKRHESNGRLMVCEAREQHCSTAVKEFLGERTGLRCIAELKAELLAKIGDLGENGKEQARADLKVVTGNMLERLVAWDLNRAEALEQSDVPLLSTVPTTESMNKVDALYILKMFRSGMKKLPGHDIRSKVGMLLDEDLIALLHFTLLVSRPILVWELDLDEV